MTKDSPPLSMASMEKGAPVATVINRRDRKERFGKSVKVDFLITRDPKERCLGRSGTYPVDFEEGAEALSTPLSLSLLGAPPLSSRTTILSGSSRTGR